MGQAENEVQLLHAKGDALLEKQTRNQSRVTDLRLDHNNEVQELQDILTTRRSAIEARSGHVCEEVDATLAHVEESKQTSIAAIESIATKSEEDKNRAIDLITQMTSQLKGIEKERQAKFVTQMKQLHEYISGELSISITIGSDIHSHCLTLV